MKHTGIVVLAMLVSACSTPTSRYALKYDRPPTVDVDLSKIEEPLVTDEPKSRYGNAPQYEVWGKTYKVLASADSFEEEGTASWYGEKFHGHRTSNGEVYDMFQFTAAHKHLPLPTFVRVTNLDNNESVIVRVNDRGPFHGDRIIDLSYAAAVRLGFADKGTAPVKVEALRPSSQQLLARPSSGPELQIRSYLDADKAQSFKQELATLLDVPVYIERKEINKQTFHRVKVGPLLDDEVVTVVESLNKHDLGTPLILSAEKNSPPEDLPKSVSTP